LIEPARMTRLPDNITNHPGATRSAAPLLEAFWGKGDAAKALYRECMQNLNFRAQPPASGQLPSPRKSRQSSPDGLKTAAQAATKLNCSIKTLRAHVAAGDLRYVIIGKGTKRPHRMFTDPDINEFIANQTRKVTPCPSTRTGTAVRRSSISTSKSTI